MSEDTDPTKKDADAGGKDGGEGKSERTFTQSELDVIVKDRLAREKEKYSGFDELKKKAEQWAAHEEAQKTELQKAQEAAQTALSEKDQALKVANDRMIRAEFISEASRLNVAHPEDAYALADRAGVQISDDGKVIGVNEAVKALVEGGRLPLTGKPKAPGMDGGAGGGDRDSDKKVELTEEERKTAAKMGLKPEAYAKQKKE